MSEGLDNIDKVFKDAFDGFEANVDPSVWTNVQNAIGGGAGGADVTPKVDPSSVAAGSMKAIVAKVAIGVAVVGAVVTTGYFVVNNDSADEEIAENVVVNETSQTSEKVAIEDNNVVTLTESNEMEATEPVANNNEVVSTTDEVEEVNTNTESNSTTEERKPTAFEELANRLNQSNSGNSNHNTNESSSASEEESNAGASVSKDNKEANTSNEVADNSSNINHNEKKEEEVELDLIPNVITPNGDGENDVIRITGKDIAKLEVVIMDKNGKAVYRLTSVEDQWNGKDMNGYDLIPGVYYLAGVVVNDAGKVKNIKRTVNLFK